MDVERAQHSATRPLVPELRALFSAAELHVGLGVTAPAASPELREQTGQLSIAERRTSPRER